MHHLVTGIKWRKIQYVLIKQSSSICRKGHEGWNKDMAEIFTAIK